ncbi:Hypothetical predicted protein [Mytilus galloprovincialis]|uniref:Uncharacterized protein n=1 Tax=Mytilus galloprovincialis TaxID=29158 RepID=A0A8B6DFS9_MYTGA|nr:Hypothetical predicted protein [Mytilus galloprovincialis]
MKICIVFITVCIVLCKGFLFDSCTTDADCTNGCCVSATFGHHCNHHFLGLHAQCHLSNKEYTTCGCGPGLVCKDHVEGSQIAIETRPGVGYCETGNKTISSGGAIATEG